MAGCKVVHPRDTAMGVAPGLHPLQQQDQLDVSRSIIPVISPGTSIGLRPKAQASGENIDVDLREVYFLVMHFLANGPCTRAFGQLWNELLQHKLLPRRYHAHYSRDGQPTEDENDDGLSYPLSYRDVASRYLICPPSMWP
jgi:hypothetical protein